MVLIAAFVVLLSTASTFLYFEQARIVKASFPDRTAQTQVFSAIALFALAIDLAKRWIESDPDVPDIVRNVHDALRFGTRYKDVLSRTAQERYDWTSVARKLSRELAPATVSA